MAMSEEKKQLRKKIYPEIGQRIKKARTALAKSIDEFEDPDIVDFPTISRIENGQTRPSIEFIQYLVVKFNINLNWIFSGKGEMFLD
jgi:transcriptional regulator with XRE-family HTH domain